MRNHKLTTHLHNTGTRIAHVQKNTIQCQSLTKDMRSHRDDSSPQFPCLVLLGHIRQKTQSQNSTIHTAHRPRNLIISKLLKMWRTAVVNSFWQSLPRSTRNPRWNVLKGTISDSHMYTHMHKITGRLARACWLARAGACANVVS